MFRGVPLIIQYFDFGGRPGIKHPLTENPCVGGSIPSLATIPENSSRLIIG
jgi:hypothetical protein